MGKAKAKKDDGGFTRITLSIPSDLRSEMDKVAANENWSAWAAECFRGRLLEIKSRMKGRGDVNKIIDRLRAAGEAEAKVGYDEGKYAGREWASDYATPKELMRFAAYFDDPNAWVGQLDALFTWPSFIACHAAAKLYAGRSEINEIASAFWERALGEEWESLVDPDANGPSDYLRGFVDGAVELWGEVGSKL